MDNNNSSKKARHEDLDLHGPEIREMMGVIPNWLVRSSSTFLLIAVIAVICFSMIFKYPDVLTAPVTIVSRNPPVTLLSKSNGKIDRLLKTQNSFVNQGDLILLIDNSANYGDIVLLKGKILELRNAIKNGGELPYIQERLALGLIQQTFSAFYLKYLTYINFIKFERNREKLNNLVRQKDNYLSSIQRQKNQLVTRDKVLVLQHNTFRRDSTLFAKKVITLAEYESSLESYLQAQNSLEELKTSFNNSNVLLSQTEYQIVDLKMENNEGEKELTRSMNIELDNLNASISEWERLYCIISPIQGKVVFNKFWAENQNLVLGESICTVIPEENHTIFARIKLPTAGSGKVKNNQLVYIKLDNFPYMEFGRLEGRIQLISSTLETSTEGVPYYSATVVLKSTLETDYNKKLDFKNDMQGIAEIVTDNLSLMSRLLQPMRAAVKNKF
jgi:multidrug efflux pump subunit AcrA (membrane-fusion protein)